MSEQQQSQAPQEQVSQQAEVHVPRPGTPESETPTSGYIPSTAELQRNAESNQQQAPNDGVNIEELSKKLGVDPTTLGQPEAPPPPEQPLSTEDWYKKQFGTKEAQEFAENFKKHFGMDIKQVYQVINNTAQVTQGLDQWRREVHAQQQIQTLQSEWGNDFENLMPAVSQRFAEIQKVNPRQAAALDNIDGARMLAALIRQEQQSGNSKVPNVAQPPVYLPNRRQISRGGSSNPSVIKMSEYVNMSDADAQSVNAGLMNGSIQIIRDM